MIQIITFVLKTAILPYWIFKMVSEYGINSLHVDPTLAFVIGSAAAFGTLIVSIKIPI